MMDQIIQQDDCAGRLKAFVTSLKECQEKSKDLYKNYDCLSKMDFLMAEVMRMAIQNASLSFRMMEGYLDTHFLLKKSKQKKVKAKLELLQGGKYDVTS